MLHLPESELGLVWYALEWAIRIGALAIVPLRREPAATRGWLLAIFFLPVPALLVFWLIGSPRFPKWRAERFARLQPFFTQTAERLSAHAPKPQPVNTLAARLGRLPVTHGNAIELIDGYDATIDRLVADIDAARLHVHILVYIFADDATGGKVIAALGRAVSRGVACRVMLDPVGSHRWAKRTMARLAAAGVDVRTALPFRLRNRTRRDMRNHRKLWAIDGIIGYAGSQNIVDRSFRPGIYNRELVARVTGPVVAEIEAVVRADWYLEAETLPCGVPDVPDPTGEAVAQLLPSGADYPLEGFETLLVWQIHQACERVLIATPYLIPDEDILGAMRTAVARGVAVDLVVSRVVDQQLVNLAQCSYYDELLSAGVRVHRFRDELLHAKNMTIDGRLAIVGSSNVDLRSFQLNSEASLLLTDAPSVAQVEAVQQGYLANSELLTREGWRARPALRKLAENIARMMSPLL
jgi:cardiolipin synthase A/B